MPARHDDDIKLGENMLSADTFREFEADALAQGFDECLVREWAPGAVVDLHVHPFSVEALVVRGEMWLTVGGATRHLRPGDTFEVPREVVHAERYGDEGTTFWVARRHHVANVAAASD